MPSSTSLYSRGSMGEGSVMGSVEAGIGDLGWNSEQLRGTSWVVVHFGSSSLLQALAPPSSHFHRKHQCFCRSSPPHLPPS
jgi:hypothetical protein